VGEEKNRKDYTPVA